MNGPLSAARLAVLRMLDRLLRPAPWDFDQRYGTVTNSPVEVADGQLPPSAFDTAVRYVATRPEVIWHICRKLPIRHEDFVFLDLGSGRGRALLAAADFPFREIVGVEVSPLHHAIANRNIGKYRSPRQRCRAIRSVCDDVRSFPIPHANLVVYMYQPFTGPVLDRVLTNLEEAARESGSTVFVCFSAPYQLQDIFVRHPCFPRLQLFETLSAEQSWALYGNESARRTYETRR
jgi:hypothetical protein